MKGSEAEHEQNMEMGSLEESLDHQKARLEDMRAMPLRAHSGIEEEVKEWTESIHYGKPDNEDVTARILAGELDTVLDEQLMRRLEYTQRTLEKIEEDSYGLCEATGKQIPRGRLEAAPETIYTIETQRLLEKGERV